MFDSKRANELFRARVAATVGHRIDLNISDWHMVDPNTAIVIIAYNKENGQPDMSEVTKLITKDFNGRVQAHLKTANIHDEGAISIVASLKRPERPASDAAKMVKVVANTFLDSRLDETWEMDTAKGTLSRVLDEDLAAILDERKRRMNPAQAHLTFASLVETKAPNSVAVGDTAKFILAGKMFEGEITQVKATTAKIKLASGEIHELDKGALFNIKGGKDAGKRDKQIQLDYYSKLYGSDFANKLVN
jgi:hypothetical protein